MAPCDVGQVELGGRDGGQVRLARACLPQPVEEHLETTVARHAPRRRVAPDARRGAAADVVDHCAVAVRDRLLASGDERVRAVHAHVGLEKAPDHARDHGRAGERDAATRVHVAHRVDLRAHARRLRMRCRIAAGEHAAVAPDDERRQEKLLARARVGVVRDRRAVGPQDVGAGDSSQKRAHSAHRRLSRRRDRTGTPAPTAPLTAAAMLVRKCGSAGRSAHLDSSARRFATSTASPAAADAWRGGSSRGGSGGAAGDKETRRGGCDAVRNACVFFTAGGVETPAWTATGRTRGASNAFASRAPKSGVGDAAHAPRRAGGVGSAAGAAVPAGGRAAENTVGDGLPGARLSGAGGVGLSRAPGSDAARFGAGGVGDGASGWRSVAAGVGIGVGPSLEASPMRTPPPKGLTVRRLVLLAIGSLLSSSNGRVPSTTPRTALRRLAGLVFLPPPPLLCVCVFLALVGAFQRHSARGFVVNSSPSPRGPRRV